MQEINTPEEFRTTIASGITLVDFWAPWCAPCRALAPVLDSLIPSHPDVQFTKVNIDSEGGMAISAPLTIASLPTLMLFKNGKKLRQLVGNTTAAKLNAFLQDD